MCVAHEIGISGDRLPHVQAGVFGCPPKGW
jgi:hypothetical protein